MPFSCTCENGKVYVNIEQVTGCTGVVMKNDTHKDDHTIGYNGNCTHEHCPYSVVIEKTQNTTGGTTFAVGSSTDINYYKMLAKAGTYTAGYNGSTPTNVKLYRADGTLAYEFSASGDYSPFSLTLDSEEYLYLVTTGKSSSGGFVLKVA